jgi:hypothetical protein
VAVSPESGLLQDQDDGQDEQQRPDADQRVADGVQLEDAANTDQEQHCGQEHRDPDVVVPHDRRVVAGRVAASAISMRDSVIHLAAAYPDQAAAIVTRDSSTASPICTMRK